MHLGIYSVEILSKIKFIDVVGLGDAMFTNVSCSADS